MDMTFKRRIAGTLAAVAILACGLGAAASPDVRHAIECLGKSPITAMVARGNALAMVP